MFLLVTFFKTNSCFFGIGYYFKRIWFVSCQKTGVAHKVGSFFVWIMEEKRGEIFSLRKKVSSHSLQKSQTQKGKTESGFSLLFCIYRKPVRAVISSHENI